MFPGMQDFVDGGKARLNLLDHHPARRQASTEKNASVCTPYIAHHETSWST